MPISKKELANSILRQLDIQVPPIDIQLPYWFFVKSWDFKETDRWFEFTLNPERQFIVEGILKLNNTSITSYEKLRKEFNAMDAKTIIKKLPEIYSDDNPFKLTVFIKKEKQLGCEVEIELQPFIYFRVAEMYNLTFTDSQKRHALNACQRFLKKIELGLDAKPLADAKPTSLQTAVDSDMDEEEKAKILFDLIITHPQIKEVAFDLFKNKNYRNAVLDAAIRLEEMVKEKANYPKDNKGKELSGVSLMHRVFDSTNPIIRWCKNETQIGKDELEGYKLIFAGTVLGIRDTKAHAIFEISPMRALKLLTLITVLAELVDASKIIQK